MDVENSPDGFASLLQNIFLKNGSDEFPPSSKTYFLPPSLPFNVIRRKQIVKRSQGLGAKRKAKKIQDGIVSFGCNLGQMFTSIYRT